MQNEMKKKLLEELIEKLSGVDDPLMGGDSEEECGKGASVKVVKVSAEPVGDKLKKKLKMEV